MTHLDLAVDRCDGIVAAEQALRRAVEGVG